MTLKEFEETRWYKGMIAKYGGEEYWVRSVDFKEMLLGLLPSFLDEDEASKEPLDELTWVRCENCELLNYKP